MESNRYKKSKRVVNMRDRTKNEYVKNGIDNTHFVSSNSKQSLVNKASIKMNIAAPTLKAKLTSYLDAVEIYKSDTNLSIPGHIKIYQDCCSSYVAQSLNHWTFSCQKCDDNDNSVNHWLIDCGGSSVSVDCDTGNDAGYTDGGSFGNTGCVTRDMGCNIVA